MALGLAGCSRDKGRLFVHVRYVRIVVMSGFSWWVSSNLCCFSEARCGCSVRRDQSLGYWICEGLVSGSICISGLAAPEAVMRVF